MTIEQRPELNRFVYPEFIAPRQSRWRRLRLLFPVWFFFFALGAELMLFASWLSGGLMPAGLACAFGISLLPFVVLLGLFELIGLCCRQAETAFDFSYDRIVLGSHKNSPVVHWPFVLKFQFEPIEKLPGMTKLVVFRSKIIRGKQRVERWYIVIEDPAQTDELLAYLQNRKSGTPLKFEIVVLDKPSPLFEDRPDNLFTSLMLFLRVFTCSVTAAVVFWRLCLAGLPNSRVFGPLIFPPMWDCKIFY